MDPPRDGVEDMVAAQRGERAEIGGRGAESLVGKRRSGNVVKGVHPERIPARRVAENARALFT